MMNLKFRKYAWLFAIVFLTTGLFNLAAAQESSGSKNPSEPIDNLTFQAADIRSVIRFLADYGQVNVVVAPNVQGSVTISLRKVMWDQALRIIGQTYDLAVVFEKGYIRVLPAAEYRQQQSEWEKRNAERVTLAQLDVKIVRLANTAAAELVPSVKSLLTDRGKVDADERTNSLIIQEVPENIDRVISFVQELDKPARQIKISAQILEIFNTGSSELGIDWVLGTVNTSDDGKTSQTQTLTQRADRVTDKLAQYNIVALQRGWDVNATVSAIVSSGKGKVIAHPEITTIDNKEARIQMGQKVPIKQFDQAGNVVIQFEEIGTILKVTPHITAENQILMHLRPERSTLQPDPSGIIINTNNAETNVVVNNSQTAVIGGLTTQNETQSQSGVPILKDIPLLGAIFRYTQKSTENRDLVIFVTPTIVEQDMAEKAP